MIDQCLDLASSSSATESIAEYTSSSSKAPALVLDTVELNGHLL